MRTSVESGPAAVARAAAILRDGGIVALPTETVYGLGADARNARACALVFEAKARPLSDPLIVHVTSPEGAEAVADLPPLARVLAAAYWPGPLTLVVPRRPVVPDLVTAGQPTVAVRMSAHPVFAAIAEEFGGPIAAPSANRFGRISPTSAAHVIEELGGRIPLVVDGGPCSHGIESTIVHVDGDSLRILRHGPITAEALATHGRIVAADAGIAAPGGLASHYAPRKPVMLVDPRDPAPGASAGLLSWTLDGTGYAHVERLSPRGDLREAAANLYAALRRLDAADITAIHAEVLPEDGLGAAIMERLRKAAAPRPE